MADALYTRNNRIFIQNGKLLWDGGFGGVINDCCCIFLNCCLADKEAEVILQGLTVNPNFPPAGIDNTCTNSNCVAINQTYIVPLPGRSDITCCAFGTLSLGTGLVCQLGNNAYVKVVLQLNETIPANSFVAISYGLNDVGNSPGRRAMVWRETGAAAIEIMWDICAGVQRTVPFYRHVKLSVAGAEIVCNSTSVNGALSTQGLCNVPQPCKLNLI